MWRQGQSDQTKLVRSHNHVTDIYGDANDNKSLFNVRSQPVIAHWVEWFGRPDSCNYPSVFCQTGRGLNLPQLDWLMFSLSLTHSLQKRFCGFVKGRKAHSLPVLPCQQLTCHWKCFPFEGFFISFGKCWSTWFVDRPFCPLKFMFSSCNDSEPLMCSTEVRPSNTRLLHYVCISVLSPSFMCVWGDRLFLFRMVCTACSYSVHC